MARFFQGRNGSDGFSRFLSWVGFALVFVSLFTQNAAGGYLSIVLWALGLLVMFYALFRTFSRRIDARRRENAAYYRARNAFTGFFKRLWHRIRDLGKFKYFTCPTCKARLRVPRKKGRVKVTCPKCGECFLGTT